MFSKILRLPEFDKDIKKLLKKFRTLEEDLDIFLKTELVLYHKLKKDNKGIFLIPRLGVENPKIYKAKKIACRSLKGRGVQSGIRVIYGYFEKEDRIELIEIYFKGDKENEDEGRIARHYRELLKKGGETEKI
jgi:mRNA-degrading endonuclease RelE of RelBE toxin-antitoxin system